MKERGYQVYLECLDCGALFPSRRNVSIKNERCPSCGSKNIKEKIGRW